MVKANGFTKSQKIIKVIGENGELNGMQQFYILMEKNIV